MKRIVRSLVLVLVIGASAIASMGSRSAASSCCVTNDDGTVTCVPPCDEPAACCIH
jgi:hypothetical protein